MTDSQSCPRCLMPITAPTAEGTCPSCGWLIPLAAETPRAYETADDRATPFVVELTPPADPDLTTTHVPAAAQPTAPQPGFVLPDIPNHTDLELIGHGGMGIVFRAVQKYTGRRVAVKVMLSFSANCPMRARFVKEVKAMAEIRHDGIVPVYEVGECSLGPYFTMELIEGCTLADRMKAGDLNLNEAVRIMASVAESIHVAHRHGIIHRDVKPSNILLDRAGKAMVADFGLAKHVGGDDDTRTGVVVGTPSYMAPEQAAAGDTTKLTDVYCLGSTLYHLATGHAPHPRGVSRDKRPEPVAPRELSPGLCETLEVIIQKSMAAEPGQRYETAAALAADLRAWGSGEFTTVRPPTRGQKVRRFLHRNRVAVGLLIALPFLVAAAAAAVRRPDPKESLEQALDRGGMVELVGEVGRPKWSEPLVGDATVGLSVLGDGSAGLTTIGDSKTVLVEDPRRDSYRFSIDIRHAEYDTSGGPSVGIFLGHERLPPVAGRPADGWLSATYSEAYSPAVRFKPALRENHGACVVHTVAARDDHTRFATEQFGPLRFTPAENFGDHNVWRGLAADVRPTGVEFFFRKSSAAAWERIATVPAEAIERQVADHAGAGYRWNPRRPLGVTAAHSSIAFRNARIEPLP